MSHQKYSAPETEHQMQSKNNKSQVLENSWERIFSLLVNPEFWFREFTFLFKNSSCKLYIWCIYICTDKVKTQSICFQGTYPSIRYDSFFSLYVTFTLDHSKEMSKTHLWLYDLQNLSHDTLNSHAEVLHALCLTINTDIYNLKFSLC